MEYAQSKNNMRLTLVLGTEQTTEGEMKQQTKEGLKTSELYKQSMINLIRRDDITANTNMFRCWTVAWSADASTEEKEMQQAAVATESAR